MIIGFTGSREGPESKDQLDMARMVFESLGITELHHGDCVGWDEVANDIAVELDVQVVVHPPTNDSLRAFCTGPKHKILRKRSYLERNETIVAACEVLVACIGPRSRGSVYTVTHARRRNKVTYKIDRVGLVTKLEPDGSFDV